MELESRKGALSDGRSLMKHQPNLRAFLSRQKSVPYCLACLHSHGGLGIESEGAAHAALLAVRSHPTALTVVFGTCSTCYVARLCLVFPGRFIESEENRWAVILLASELVPKAA
jgi:hypothetical protein